MVLVFEDNNSFVMYISHYSKCTLYIYGYRRIMKAFLLRDSLTVWCLYP
jgi:hypothetical protein